MPEFIKAKCRLLADDSIIYQTVSSEEDCEALQKGLDALQEWEKLGGSLRRLSPACV